MKKILILLGVLISFGTMAQTPAVIYADSVFVKDSEGNSTKVYSVGDNASEADMVNQLDTVLIPQTKWGNSDIGFVFGQGENKIAGHSLMYPSYFAERALNNLSYYSMGYVKNKMFADTIVLSNSAVSTPDYVAAVGEYNGVALYMLNEDGSVTFKDSTANDPDLWKWHNDEKKILFPNIDTLEAGTYIALFIVNYATKVTNIELSSSSCDLRLNYKGVRSQGYKAGINDVPINPDFTTGWTGVVYNMLWRLE